MSRVPQPGDVIPVRTGDATVLQVKDQNDRITILAHRDHPHHKFATWGYAPGRGLFSGHYFTHLAEAEEDFHER
jgi:hypothetical protein